MKIICFFLFFWSLAICIQAQQRAITGKGEEVILYDDGTWEYAEGEPHGTDEQIPTNPIQFTKSKSANFAVESTVIDDVEVDIDSKKWRFKKSGENSASEYSFEHKTAALYAMLITEKIELPMSLLKKAALSNAREAADNVQVTKEEYRVVNGQTVYMMELNGTIEGMPFTYLGYYYSGANGTLQLLAYTIQNLYEQHKDVLEEFLNGLIIK